MTNLEKTARELLDEAERDLHHAKQRADQAERQEKAWREKCENLIAELGALSQGHVDAGDTAKRLMANVYDFMEHANWHRDDDEFAGFDPVSSREHCEMWIAKAIEEFKPDGKRLALFETEMKKLLDLLHYRRSKLDEYLINHIDDTSKKLWPS